MRKNEKNILSTALVLFAIVIALLILKSTISMAQAIEVTITFVLVLVTFIYAIRTAEIADATREQAKVSVKMAEEMKQQRYDTVRPVIDFKFRESYPIMISQGLTPKEREEGNLSSGIRCMLCNIGIGPATDVYSFTLTVSGERRQIYLGSLVKGETTPETILSLEQRDDCWFSVANYRDAYGRCFESSREVHLDMETGKPELGPLTIVQPRSSK